MVRGELLIRRQVARGALPFHLAADIEIADRELHAAEHDWPGRGTGSHEPPVLNRQVGIHEVAGFRVTPIEDPDTGSDVRLQDLKEENAD